MLTKRDIFVLLLGLSVVTVVFAYFKPVSIFSCSDTQSELDILEKITQKILVTPTEFDTVNQEKLAFLLKGCYLSELLSFDGSARAFPLNLTPIENGHAAVKNGTLFLFMRKSKTLHDFANDALIWRRATTVGRVYAGPDNVAQKAKTSIQAIIENNKVNKMVIAGVSLGAAVGAIVAEAFMESFPVSLILFNPFQFADAEFRQHLAAGLRSCYFVKNVNDVCVDPIDSRIGVPIFFDKKEKSKSDAHCKIASLLLSIGPDEIDNKTFYFSDEFDHSSPETQETTKEDEELSEQDPMSPLIL